MILTAISNWWNRHSLAGAMLCFVAFNLPWLFKLGVFTGHIQLHELDTLMRLAIAKDMQSDGWRRPVLFMGEDAPFGMVLHWSSLFFWAILAVAKLLWFAPPFQALSLVGVFTGPTLQVCSVFAGYWTARPLLPKGYAAAYALTIVLFPFCFSYAHAGVANHHAVLHLVTLVLFGIGVRVELGQVTIRLMAVAGLVAGLGLWISFEALPFAELLWACLFLGWVELRPQAARHLLIFGTVFCGTAVAALLIDPPHGGYASVELDRISLPYVFAIGLQLACVLICRAFEPGTIRGRLVELGVLAIIAAAIEMLVFPMILGGPEAQINPFVRTEWQGYIDEMQPADSPGLILVVLGNGIIGAVALLWPLASFGLRKTLYLAGLVLFGVLAQHVNRFAPYIEITGSLAAFHGLHRLVGRSALRGPGLKLLSLYGALFLMFGTITIGNKLLPFPIGHVPGYRAECSLPPVLPALNDPGFLQSKDDSPIFVTQLDKSPELLFYTNYRTLAGDYHPDARGLNDMFLLMRDLGWNTAHSVVQDHRISYFLLCPTSDRDRYGVTDTPLFWKYSTPEKQFRQPTFYTRIMDGTLPPWLVQRPWPEGVRTNLKLFKVVEPTATKPFP